MIRPLLAATLLAAALAGCGGSSKPPTDPLATRAEPAPADQGCVTAGDRVGVVVGGKEGLAADDSKKLAHIITERCSADAWSAEVVACLGTAEGDDELSKCAEALTEEQNRTVKDQVDRELGEAMEGKGRKAEDAAASPPTTGAPADTMQQEGGSGHKVDKKRAAPPKPDDPCGGGE